MLGWEIVFYSECSVREGGTDSSENIKITSESAFKETSF